jgi:carbonic anhydrase
MTRENITPEQALERLKEGNRRFTSGTLLHNQVSQERLASLVSVQRPFAAILGCSDSRVPPELVFDQGFGDLFVVRLAGNVIATKVYGSLQFARRLLGVPLLVVLGHEGCGAVAATLACKLQQAEHPEYIQALVDSITPALKDLEPGGSPAEQLKAAVEANVRWSMHQCSGVLAEQPGPIEQRDFHIVGAVYELATGRVRWLDD